MTLDLHEFERRLRVRPLTLADFEAVTALQRACFPGMPTWTREQFESQLQTFAEGQIGVELEGRLVASSSSLILEFAEYSDWHDWRRIADRGYIRNHDPEGDTLYGIEIMVDPEFRGMKLARRLYDARKALVRARDLARIIIGGRIPGYGEHADRMTATEYVARVIRKELHDPVLTAQLANGFVLKRLIPDYLPSDEASRGYATFLEWVNLEHGLAAGASRRGPGRARICVVQYQMRRVADFEDFSRQAEYFVDVAADHRADFVVFPELFTMQLLSALPPARPGIAARQLAEFTPRYLETFTRCALRYNINIVGGSQFTVEGERLLNVAYLFRRDGTLGRQAKLHITPNERRWWGVQPGDRLEVLDTDCGRIAILVCYDVEFPELARVAAARGARVLFVPFNTDERHGFLRVRTCAQARCVENHVYAVLAGCVGNLPSVENADVHYAQSGIYTPADYPFDRDAIAAECADNIETVVVHDLDLDLLERHRRRGSVRNWDDRRTDLYRIQYRDTTGASEI